MEPVVLDVERVPAEPRPVGEQDALGAGCGDVDQRADRIGAVADVDSLRFEDVCLTREVGVPVARRGQERSWCHEDLEGGAVVERERLVCARLGKPQVHQLTHFVWAVVDGYRLAGAARLTAPGHPRRTHGDSYLNAQNIYNLSQNTAHHLDR
jgi:hypothetical protein